MIKKALIAIALATTALMPFNISADTGLNENTSTVTAASMPNTMPVEYTRPIFSNVDLAINKNDWQKVGSDLFKFSITTLDSLITDANGQQWAIVYYKLTSDNPYVVAQIRKQGMPTFIYIIDVHCFNLTNSTSIPLARIFIGAGNEQLQHATSFNTFYMDSDSKISQNTRKYLLRAYNLKK